MHVCICVRRLLANLTNLVNQPLLTCLCNYNEPWYLLWPVPLHTGVHKEVTDTRVGQHLEAVEVIQDKRLGATTGHTRRR